VRIVENVCNHFNVYVNGVDTSDGKLTQCKKGENMKDYDLLQEGDDWTVLSWNPITESWLKTVTYHSDSWGISTRIAAEEYVANRRVFNLFRSKYFLSERIEDEFGAEG